MCVVKFYEAARVLNVMEPIVRTEVSETNLHFMSRVEA